MSDDKILPETLEWVRKHKFISRHRTFKYGCVSPNDRRMLRASSLSALIVAVNREMILHHAARWRDRIHNG